MQSRGRGRAESDTRQKEHVLRPIGTVRSPIKEVADDCWGGVTAVIELDAAQFSPECTKGLEDFSHLEVIFLLDRIPPESVLTGSKHPRERQDWPEVGVFAQRTKNRPNRIGVTVCKIEAVQGLRISVRELDAVDGTPVLDIKPYIEEFGPREPVRQPAWARELMAGYFRPRK
jgi:tRNA-Thr(GGU) m(6)t(6)A37 methyltransferase TsaA